MSPLVTVTRKIKSGFSIEEKKNQMARDCEALKMHEEEEVKV